MSLCLLDLDNTLLAGRTVQTLAAHFDVLPTVAAALAIDSQHASAMQSERVMSAFAGVDAQEFDAACAKTPLREGAVAACRQLQEAGFALGIVTASYLPAADYVARQIGATAVAAAVPEVKDGKVTGRLEASPWLGDCGHHVCKKNVARAWRDGRLVAIGDGANDVCMFQEADLAIAMSPCDDAARQAAHHVASHWSEVPGLVASFAGAPRTMRADPAVHP